MMRLLRKIMDRVARRFGYRRGNDVFKLAPGFTRCGMSRYLSALTIGPAAESDAIATNPSEPRIVWQMWLQGEENAPLIVRKCIDSVRKFTQPHRHVLLTEKNLHEWIEIPAVIWERYREKSMSVAIFSDYVRLSLLERYGGVWIDATVLITGTVPDEMLMSKQFLFSSPFWAGADFDSLTPMVLGPLRFFSDKPSCTLFGSNWWICATPGNRLIALVRAMLADMIIRNRLTKDYMVTYNLISLVLCRDAGCRRAWKSMPKHSTVPTQLLRSVLDEKYDGEVLQAIEAMSPIHKLKYKGKRKPGSFRDELLKGTAK